MNKELISESEFAFKTAKKEFEIYHGEMSAEIENAFTWGYEKGFKHMGKLWSKGADIKEFVEPCKQEGKNEKNNI